MRSWKVYVAPLGLLAAALLGRATSGRFGEGSDRPRGSPPQAPAGARAPAVATPGHDAAVATPGHDAHDPEGIARRNPESMHGHQRDWPSGCSELDSHRQSPISLGSEWFVGTRTSALSAGFGPSQASLIDVGHTFQVRLTRTEDHVDFEGARYRLAQFHFHKPAEHLVDGRQAPMEVHFVFLRDRSSDVAPRGPRALVLGYPVELGAEHPELARIWAHLPPMREGYGEELNPAALWERALGTSELDMDDLHHAETVLRAGLTIDVSRILPGRADFLVYEGSLTTPPCAEGITHAFASVPIYVSEEQTEHFEGYYEGNNRDLQPIGPPAGRAFRRAALTVGPGR
jgi:carbonic anhydrase